MILKKKHAQKTADNKRNAKLASMQRVEYQFQSSLKSIFTALNF